MHTITTILTLSCIVVCVMAGEKHGHSEATESITTEDKATEMASKEEDTTSKTAMVDDLETAPSYHHYGHYGHHHGHHHHGYGHHHGYHHHHHGYGYGR